MRKLPKIVVTNELIQLAARENSRHCMIADAIKAALPDALNVGVDGALIGFSFKEKDEEGDVFVRYQFATPVVARENLLRFDKGTVVQPFEFKFPLRAMRITRRRSQVGRVKTRKASITTLSEVAEGRTYRPTVQGGRPQRIERDRVYGLKVSKDFDPTKPAVAG